MLETGQVAPDFNLPDETGETVCLNDFDGKNIVLYFYPKDNTPGCTKESISFSHHKDEFKKYDTIILGASKDSVKKHQNFIKKQNLTIKLLVDAEGTLCDDYTVWVMKKLYGRDYMRIERATFLIGKDRKIKRVWRKVKVNGHVEEVLDAVKEL
ncbi:MAG: thioredoxin-dependent thiol peroxidase [Kordiimonadaceae bacterium]|jgi:thioredoxin-dependent peroxiredoxin|nr:thioredoxin-dependent thiol peroxidase [Kordiimonadaceae bacterium]MBT6035225.1 thioredoxin-dependent thiol peroxidase [Kordiimonadaceae bacterium]MBT6330071.1 thioredoxin-dependent thiol peroxidase [Kordiimonadaceae bacterium]MBT7581497.1 thioredoxin-dependent thiol peroxidase [Kordiimonadaceae bacterium]